MQLAVVSLFDESGNALRPWAGRGFACYAYDILNDGRIERFPSGGFIEYRRADLTDARFVDEAVALRPAHVMGFPPCTDLAVCGTRAWAAKAAVNPNFQHEAVALCRVVETVGEACGAPWILENPVSRLSTMWRRFDHLFNPYEYGGYLPEDDVHPRWPKYILPRDAYPKKTCLWIGGGWRMPLRRPVEVQEGYSEQYFMLGGKSAKTKQIRSETPRGFAIANFMANWVIPTWNRDPC